MSPRKGEVDGCGTGIICALSVAITLTMCAASVRAAPPPPLVLAWLLWSEHEWRKARPVFDPRI